MCWLTNFRPIAALMRCYQEAVRRNLVLQFDPGDNPVKTLTVQTVE